MEVININNCRTRGMLQKQFCLSPEISFHVLVIIQVIAAQIGKDRCGETAPGDPSLVNGMRRYLQGRRLYSLFQHICQNLLQSYGIRGGEFGRYLHTSMSPVYSPYYTRVQSGFAEDSFHEICDRGLTISARNGYEVHFFTGVSIKGTCQEAG